MQQRRRRRMLSSQDYYAKNQSWRNEVGNNNSNCVELIWVEMLWREKFPIEISVQSKWRERERESQRLGVCGCRFPLAHYKMWIGVLRSRTRTSTDAQMSAESAPVFVIYFSLFSGVVKRLCSIFGVILLVSIAMDMEHIIVYPLDHVW